jgi:hypothetical protein
MSDHDQCLVITFVESTHVLAINENEELDEAEVPCFATDKMTVFCGSLDNDHVAQVRILSCTMCATQLLCSLFTEVDSREPVYVRSYCGSELEAQILARSS